MTRQTQLRRLTLHAVRTYERLTLEFEPGLTVLVGPNGVGKTNVLEACAVALSGSSPRTSSELRLIRDGERQARIAALVDIDGHLHERDVTLEAGRGKRLRLDGSPARSTDEYAAHAPVVTFLPERLLVIRGAPQRRRALIDQLTSRTLPAAGATLRDYTTALQQRNTLLRRAKAGHNVAAQLQPWTQQLLELGATIREQRTGLLAALAAPYATRFEELTGLQDATFTAARRGSGNLPADAADCAADERRRGTTLFGPHLDDVLPLHAGRDLRAFGSAGEQRSALLAFTLAARDLLVEHTGVEPVVLLDEPWSELDADRRRRLTRIAQGLGQVVITSTEPPTHLTQVAPAARVLQVSSGQVQPWRETPDT